MTSVKSDKCAGIQIRLGNFLSEGSVTPAVTKHFNQSVIRICKKAATLYRVHRGEQYFLFCESSPVDPEVEVYGLIDEEVNFLADNPWSLWMKFEEALSVNAPVGILRVLRYRGLTD